MLSRSPGAVALREGGRGAAVYLAVGYALSRSRGCAIDERPGAEAPDHDPCTRQAC